MSEAQNYREVDLSIIIPVYNEEGNVELLYNEIVDVLSAYNRSYELIFIDDGSTDRSFEILNQIQLSDDHVLLVQFRKNFGQTAALAAGFEHSQGKVVITMDADLQNDPADIPMMVDNLEEGFDMVCGWRSPRMDNYFLRIIPSRVANYFIGFLTNLKLHDYGCTLKAMRSDLAKHLELYGEMHRLIPALASFHGADICEVKVNHRPRRTGTSKYGLTRTFGVILDIVTLKFFMNYSSRPIQFFGGLGLSLGFLGCSILSWYAIRYFAFGMSLNDRPMLLLAILLVVAGLQFITFGLLAELQIRTYHESQNKPIYKIRKMIGKIDIASRSKGILDRD